ncbi:insecticidal delta-endotoxin Cry8Ea1 family protein [Tahibacter soli]|uniref:Insecticidal delta-endotoxin Cry8Ea1 family protein n=1 Tax=Tahibacter soli TaxID=2983605 RepID=A0A9X3YK16_9GAMM|nr:insecticidal delta-endotoxin Cry8Ea1 family protein [Tahibacter soli]MDC8012620.1 insecticidal delta-endotoxin Cry8Ea1 family protein [Tahibacter soli]
MAFYPVGDKNYRIVFKHSDKCFDVGDIHRGMRVRQSPVDVNSNKQLFQFRKLSARHYAIRSVHSGKSLDVARASHDDGTVLCQWDPSDGEWNEHFRFMPAGDGMHYYLIACHSEKTIVADGGTSATGENIVQSGRPGGTADWTKVRFVPESDSLDGISGRDFIADSSGKTRTIVIGIVNKVPEIGGGLSALMGLFWPADDGNARVWDQMRRYVNDLVRELIEQDKLDQLSKLLDGLRLQLAAYNKEQYGSAIKGGMFTTLLGLLNAAEPFFFDPADPQRRLPFFVALGTIRLAALRELYTSYKQIYNEDDRNAAQHLKDLQDKIKKFTAAATLSRARALEWRIGKVKVVHTESTEWGVVGPSTTHRWAAHDEYDGFRREWSYNTLTGGTGNAESLARKAHVDRQEEVRSQFSAELDRFLSPARTWRYLDPAVTDKPTQIPVDMQTGPVGGQGGTEFLDDPKNKPITRIVVYAGARVDGLEIFYGGVSGGLHGKRGGSTHAHDLEPGEKIIGVWGRAGAALDALYFETNKNRQIGGGGGGGNEWIASPSDDMGSSLWKVGGRKGSAHIEAVKFFWRYIRED